MSFGMIMSSLGMTCRQRPMPSHVQIKKKEAWVGPEKPALR